MTHCMVQLLNRLNQETSILYYQPMVPQGLHSALERALDLGAILKGA